MEQELLDYIRAAGANGDSDETITANLKSAGWNDVQIGEAMMEITMSQQPTVAAGMASSPKFGWKKIWKYGKYPLAVLIVAVLAFAGFKAYSYFVSNPDKVWNDTSQKMTELKSAHFNVEASYSETVTKDESGGSDFDFLGGEGELKFSVTGKGDMAIKQADADYDMDSTVNIKYGPLSFGMDFSSRKIGENVYYKMDNNPLLGFLGSGSGTADKSKKWLKINLKESMNSELTVLDVQKEQILQAFKKAKLMRPTKLLGSETVDGVATWHYQAELNKQELKNYFEELQKILKPDELTNLQAIVDKLEFKKLELWIGKYDHLIHQAVIESNAPSIVAYSLNSARDKSRDARRMADVRQIQTALELFYNDNSRYPLAENGQILMTDGGQFKFNSYMIFRPVAPTPADGSCTDENNKYKYEQLSGGTSYRLTFCVGNKTGGFEAGVVEASPSGLKTIIPGIEKTADPLEGIPFNATIQVKLGLSNFNSDVKIEEPQDAFDAGIGTRDARRLADVRQIQTALELFYNDNNRYPAAVNGEPSSTDGEYKFPTYITLYPSAPTPADGSCTAENNKYNYEQFSGGSNYKLTFCLGNDTGGYSAGLLEASGIGIQSKK